MMTTDTGTIYLNYLCYRRQPRRFNEAGWPWIAGLTGPLPWIVHQPPHHHLGIGIRPA